MVLRDRLTAVDVWFGFQVDGKLSLKMPNWSQFGAVISEWEASFVRCRSAFSVYFIFIFSVRRAE